MSTARHCLRRRTQQPLPRRPNTVMVRLAHAFGDAGALDKLPRWPAALVNRRPTPQCSLEFQAYEPSEWEAEWRDKAEEYQHKACKTMLAQSQLVDAWMEPMNASFSSNVVASQLPEMQNSKVNILFNMPQHFCRRVLSPYVGFFWRGRSCPSHLPCAPFG